MATHATIAPTIRRYALGRLKPEPKAASLLHFFPTAPLASMEALKQPPSVMKQKNAVVVIRSAIWAQTGWLNTNNAN